MKSKIWKRSAFLVLALAALLFFLSFWTGFQRIALAQAGDGVRIEVRAGFDGLCKDGAWIPVKVSIENQGDSLEANIEIHNSGLNTPASTFTQPISLPSNAHKETFIFFHPDSFVTEIDVDLVAARRVITQATTPITCISGSDRLFGVLSGNPSSFNLLADLDPPGGRASIARLEAVDLPDRSPALQSLDYLIVSNLDTGLLTPRQVEALDGWISAGGILIATGGPNWQPSSANIASLLPYLPDRTITVTGILDLPGEAILSIGDLAPGAEIMIAQDGAPILVRSRHGAGYVYYLTADPSLEPLKSWGGMQQFYEGIISAQVNSPIWVNGIQSWDSARNAVSALPELALPPFGLLCGFLAVYVAALGPVNYLVLKRINRKELAWISIPLLVVAFSVLAFMVGSRGRGKEPVISRLAAVQVWPDSQQAQVIGLLGIFTPNRTTYNLQIDRNFLPHPMPGMTGLTPAGGWTFETTPDDNIQVRDMRADVASINALALEGQIPSPAIDGELALRLTRQGISLEGEIQNRSDLALKGAVLLSPGAPSEIGDLNPGDSRQFQITLSNNDKASFEPVLPTSNTTGSVAFYPPYASNSSFITDILGTGDYYRDQETFRRFNLLNALASYSNPNGTGSGVYLAGWSDGSPLTVGLDGREFRSSDTTLYLIALPLTVMKADGPINLTPGLFTWSILDSGAGIFNPSPYDGYLEGGDFSIQYRLSQPIPYSQVKSLTLHLKSYELQGPTGFNQYLWDFKQAAWVSLSGVDWGDTSITEPDRFVGPNSEIRLRLEQTGNSAYLPIERADFTLEVEP